MRGQSLGLGLFAGIAVLLMSFVGGVPDVSAAEGETLAADSMLGSLSDAMGRRDSAALGVLLAADFVHEIVPTVQGGRPETREEYLAATSRILAAPGVSHVRLSFVPGYQVLSEDGGRSWRIENLRWTLEVTLEGEPMHVQGGPATVYVCKDQGSEGRYAIYRWVDRLE